MLIPQFSLRWLLAVMTACAVVFSIFGLAVRGSHWAAGVSIAIVSLAVVMLIYAVVFGLVWAFSVVTSQFRHGSAGSGRSPFAGRATASSTPGPSPPGGGASLSHKGVPATPIILD